MCPLGINSNIIKEGSILNDLDIFKTISLVVSKYLYLF